ncbi:fructosamine kinase family protein [Aquimarina sp. Aq107]|uniref:fructosamine kinase family protein n=1 Tax=Aquimarina sp. Aq107 TaxID=1191912 RepID=UPI001F346CF9|nr:fructosamine kinase family protein [Aquimarina sp. Aq107]
MSKKLIKHLENLLSERIISTKPLSGGDINEAFLLTTNNREMVVKINSVSKFPGMFKAEARGLKELMDANIFKIPEVLFFGKDVDVSFLLLEYIKSGNKTPDFWSIFGERLASLHQQSKPYFGFESDNYIGSLQQYNFKYSSASEFYITQRLQPQFQMAIKRGFSFSSLDSFYVAIENEIPDEASSLIHGDLWSGNFMIDINGSPCLIDPAVAYASREMDISMMYLFGGFEHELFEVYNDIFPLIDGWKKRMEIWQLYYLLVHLNLFGDSYLPQIQSILKKYS